MQAVVQLEQAGCAIASAAAIAGISYRDARKIANGMGISAEDSDLWSKTHYIRRLLTKLGVRTGKKEVPFVRWGALPDCALLSTKWHLENGKPSWHWVVFVREDGREYVLDSKKSLITNVRTDFGRIKPKWSIEVIV